MNNIFKHLLIFAFNSLILQELIYCEENKLNKKKKKRLTVSKQRLPTLAKKELNTEFENFKIKFNKNYKQTEELYRINVFETNVREMKRLNTIAKRLNKLDPARFGVNKYCDMTKEEFKITHFGANLSKFMPTAENTNQFLNNKIKAKSLVSTKTSELQDLKTHDLRTKDVLIEPPTSQSDCGCCWAFSAIYVAEAKYALKHEVKKRLSVQEVVNCDKNSYGCNGGNPYYAFEWGKNNGFSADSVCPFKAVEDTCLFDEKLPKVKVLDHYYYMYPSEFQLNDILLTEGTFSFAINADKLQLYEKGILDLSEQDCPVEGVNHAVTMVGFGTTNNEDYYWIVKNSWGGDWGERGYFRIKFGTNVCGLTTFAFCANMA